MTFTEMFIVLIGYLLIGMVLLLGIIKVLYELAVILAKRWPKQCGLKLADYLRLYLNNNEIKDMTREVVLSHLVELWDTDPELVILTVRKYVKRLNKKKHADRNTQR